jgi:hypothetical protein
MSAHTPGPWSVEKERDFWNVTSVQGDIVGIEGLYRCDGSDEANARLIAAAPELLEALRYMLRRYVELVESGDAGDWNPETETEVIEARAAIAKAEGKP